MEATAHTGLWPPSALSGLAVRNHLRWLECMGDGVVEGHGGSASPCVCEIAGCQRLPELDHGVLRRASDRERPHPAVAAIVGFDGSEQDGTLHRHAEGRSCGERAEDVPLKEAKAEPGGFPEGFGEDPVSCSDVVAVEVDKPGEDESSEEGIGLTRLPAQGHRGRAHPLGLIEAGA